MTDPLRLGVVGLGRAFMLMLPTLAQHPLVRLVGASDPREEARRQFEADFSRPHLPARAYASLEQLCADERVEALYIASPHQFHVEHVRLAAQAGKHILVEKPMALTIEDCQAMIDAARRNAVHLMVGHSHSFDAPYLRTAMLIRSGSFGRPRMITAANYTDFLYRPRRPEELDTSQGGGVVFSQAAHQVDVVRLLAASAARSVRAVTGRFDPSRPTEGAYQAFLTFDEGASATLTYSGYGRYDSDEALNWFGEMGRKRNPESYGAARRALAKVSTPEEEAALKNTRAYGIAPSAIGSFARPAAHNHFGHIIVSCEKADLRPMADGVMIYADDKRWLEPLPQPAVPRAEVIDELYAAVRKNVPPLHSGEWGMATLEICLGILESARSGNETVLAHQRARGPVLGGGL
ncbi:Gfo/Idh/MocA family protein [Ancylobacter polymorphus]|uniref:Phthalate 4,5-cis-dihydrodiol dehydrogenase n=1 Tax=Ancylobacter polymorphus TaxID=223390 RepID=A0ABU0BG83_9HYPH|nr:Gfo/Idh/MocA family oxidoreductase [Ancylobacter polymorphus]MDQ0304847.1 phthalate 4,5-cis-dihydrodiol dehydrogenase [Ancylobacter polymorphus]